MSWFKFLPLALAPQKEKSINLSPQSPPKGAGESVEDLRMDIIAQARELAKEIQKDERYLALQLAQQLSLIHIYRLTGSPTRPHRPARERTARC